MAKPLSELFAEVARQATAHDETLLAHLCRMAAIESTRSNISLDWDWDVSEDCDGHAARIASIK